MTTRVRSGPAGRAAAAALLGFVAVAFAGCDSVVPGHPVCPRSAKLVPACGVLWGVATNPNTAEQLHRVERSQTRPFDMVYRFHDLDDRIPTPDERALVKSGRVLHVSIDSRRYQPPARTIRWADVANGEYDSALTAQAKGIASLDVPVFVTFDHEPDQPQHVAAGSPPDFIAAWRHVHDIFARSGATNAVWVWVVTGFPADFATAGRLWPGNTYVDWISWEAYNSSGCRSGSVDPALYRSFADAALPFYRWLMRYGPSLRIDIAKPMIISEASSVVYQDPALTARWYREIPAVLRAHPQLRAIGLWDRPGTGNCPFQFDAEATVRDAVSTAGMQQAVLGHEP